MITNFVSKVLANTGVTLIPSQWSKTDYRSMIFWIVAGAVAILEQLFDAFKTDIQAVVIAAPPQTAPWIKKKVLEFQYDAANPQVLVLNEATATYAYPTIDTTLQIIKYGSVVAGSAGVTLIKGAKDNAGSPQATTTPESNAIQNYLNTILAPGLKYIWQSLATDRLYMVMDVYYIGQYSGVIQTNVIAGITTFLKNIPFDGNFTLSDFEVAIKAVTGVTDVIFRNIQARADATTVLYGTKLVLSSTVVQRDWATVAGYIAPEAAPYGLTNTRADGSGLLNLNLIAV
jgi:hypothetical protein